MLTNDVNTVSDPHIAERVANINYKRREMPFRSCAMFTITVCGLVRIISMYGEDFLARVEAVAGSYARARSRPRRKSLGADLAGATRS